MKKSKDLPALVEYIHLMGVMKIPIGSSLFDEALEKHPEHFPEHVARRKAWDSIPQEVHDLYSNECAIERKKADKDRPHPNGGVIHMMECAKCMAHSKKYSQIMREVENKLHQKYYEKYLGPKQ